jgi:hypothetical protein
MNPKSTLALATAFGACFLAASGTSYAENQSEWLQRQLEITDGYAPPPAQTAIVSDPARAPAYVRSETAPNPDAAGSPIPPNTMQGDQGPRTPRTIQGHATPY